MYSHERKYKVVCIKYTAKAKKPNTLNLTLSRINPARPIPAALLRGILRMAVDNFMGKSVTKRYN